MRNVGLKKIVAIGMIAATAVSVTGCSTSQAGKKATEYQETEENTLDRGMENQPESSYWFPDELLAWDFSEDVDAKYNISEVPLAERVEKEELPHSNDTQNAEMNVVALGIMNSSTSGNAPRGINTFDANVFSYWQYIDQLVYWGGSSGEGIIVPPSADVVDAAHKNGVPVLGTIFFPQTAHGGKIEWLNTFLEKDETGSFPMTDKLIEVADVYGFDGWFINQETDTEVTSFDDVAQGKTTATKTTDGLTKEHADLMREFISEFQQKADQELEIMWYDSMTTDGKMDWQNALTDENKDYLVDAQMEPVADSMFLNFWWNTEKLADQELLKASQKKAEELAINPYDLYAGIDIQEEGYMTPVDWQLFTDANGVPYTSLGLYVPSWTYFSASDPDDFQTRENIFWVNSQGDPTQGVAPTGEEWPGISTYAVEQTAITNLPFVTNFNLGNGYNYFIEGQKVSSMDWNNRSMQDILPTYRWTFQHEAGNELAVTVDYADAYNGGNSLKLKGKMEKGQSSLLKMYATQLSIASDTQVTTTAKATTDTALDLVVTLADGSVETLKGDSSVTDEWTTVSYDTKAISGQVITGIDYQVTAEATDDVYELRLGQLALTPKAEKNTVKVAELAIEDALFDEEEGNLAGIRFTWAVENPQQGAFYELYRINEDQSRSFLGATPATNYYMNGLERRDDTNQTEFEVVAVDPWGVRSGASQAVILEWPDNQLPKAAFNVSRTLIAPGEQVTFSNQSSANTETLKWEFEGGDIGTSDEETPVVTYKEAGVYSVKLTAENAAGSGEMERVGLITVSEEAAGELALLSKDAKTSASSFVNDGEAPEFAVDGKLDTKWCATGNPPHEITLDLGSVKTVSQVQIAHAEAGGEGADMNTKAYTIEVSEDGQSFTQVSRTLNNQAAESLDTFAATPAQYVKVIIDKPTQGSDSAARIYEIGVYGLATVIE